MQDTETTTQIEDTTTPTLITIDPAEGHPGYLSGGRHRVKIAAAEVSRAKSGNSQLVLKLEAVDYPHAGKIARSWITLTDSARQFQGYFARALFPDRETQVQFQPHELIGRELRIDVEWPDDKEYPQVARFYPV
jgi:hypothetical protein